MSADELHHDNEAAGDDCCANCRFWQAPKDMPQEKIDAAAARGFRCAGRCKRFPTAVVKYGGQWCGEHERAAKSQP